MIRNILIFLNHMDLFGNGIFDGCVISITWTYFIVTSYAYLPLFLWQLMMDSPPCVKCGSWFLPSGNLKLTGRQTSEQSVGRGERTDRVVGDRWRRQRWHSGLRDPLYFAWLKKKWIKWTKVSGMKSYLGGDTYQRHIVSVVDTNVCSIHALCLRDYEFQTLIIQEGNFRVW